MDITVIAQEFNRMINLRNENSLNTRKQKAKQYKSWELPHNQFNNLLYYLNVPRNQFACEEAFFNKTTIEKINVNSNDNEYLLKNVKSLKSNWDGNGGVPPDHTVIANANAFISILPLSIANELNENKIIPTPYGTLVFDWEKNSNLISVEIGENEIGFFTEFSDEKNIASEGILFNKNSLPLDLAKAFKKLYQQTI